MRLNLASALSLVGDNRAAAKFVGYDRVGIAALTSNWPALAQAAESMGPQYWDQYDFWNTPALLIQTGHSDTIANLYDMAKPLIASGRISLDKVARPETIIALRNVGRRAEADRLFAQFRKFNGALPKGGILGDEKRFGSGIIAALTGDRETAIRVLDQWSRRRPFRITPIPAMALRHDPIFGSLASDPRFAAIEDRVWLAVNAERAKAGLPPVSHEAWIGDAKALLTKN